LKTPVIFACWVINVDNLTVMLNKRSGHQTDDINRMKQYILFNSPKKKRIRVSAFITIKTITENVIPSGVDGGIVKIYASTPLNMTAAVFINYIVTSADTNKKEKSRKGRKERKKNAKKNIRIEFFAPFAMNFAPFA
jgi:hypothetical protein